jgi:hypothetical protein
MTESDRARIYNYKTDRKLIEAIVLIIKDEINILREKHDLAERTNEQIIVAIMNKLEILSDYEE